LRVQIGVGTAVGYTCRRDGRHQQDVCKRAADLLICSRSLNPLILGAASHVRIRQALHYHNASPFARVPITGTKRLGALRRAPAFLGEYQRRSVNLCWAGLDEVPPPSTAARGDRRGDRRAGHARGDAAAPERAVRCVRAEPGDGGHRGHPLRDRRTACRRAAVSACRQHLADRGAAGRVASRPPRSRTCAYRCSRRAGGGCNSRFRHPYPRGAPTRSEASYHSYSETCRARIRLHDRPGCHWLPDDDSHSSPPATATERRPRSIIHASDMDSAVRTRAPVEAHHGSRRPSSPASISRSRSRANR
jgi:hypothetical protein